MGHNTKTWSKHAFKYQAKCDVLINNLTKSFNSTLLATRDKPILTMAEWIRKYIMKRFSLQREKIKTCQGHVSQCALRRRAKARLTGALSKGGKMRGLATNVYLWKTSEKPKETGQNENSKFGSCIYV